MQVVHEIRYGFRFVFYREDGENIAHCLETDTVATGKTFMQAVDNLSQAITIEIVEATARNDQASLWNPAPAKYFALLLKSKPYAKATAEGKVIVKTEGAQIAERLEEVSSKLHAAMY